MPYLGGTFRGLPKKHHVFYFSQKCRLFGLAGVRPSIGSRERANYVLAHDDDE